MIIATSAYGAVNTRRNYDAIPGGICQSSGGG